MMSRVIQQETTVFLLSVLHGAGLLALYDFLRAFRRVFRHGTVAVAAEDFLFWVVSAFLTFCFAFFGTDGVVRGYAVAGILSGALLYHGTVSRYVIFLMVHVFRLLQYLLRGIRKTVSVPVEKIWIKWKKSVVFERKRGYNKRTSRRK